MKVSVIVPIYNVSRFIERCAESLMLQTLDGVEYIFVDDATPDNSIELLRGVIERYPKRTSQVKIVEHKQNKGLPAARNTGLAVAGGEYIFHCDSDDYVEPNMLEQLYNAAKKENADIVWCDYFIAYENNERCLKQPSYATPEEAIKGMLCGKMKYNVWNKLAKRSLYVEGGILFPAGYSMGEDMTMIKLFVYAKRVAYLPNAFYHYVQFNTSSLTQAFTPVHLAALRHNTDIIVRYIKEKYGSEWNQDIYSFCMLMKWPFLISDKREMYSMWKEWFPEANAYIWQDKQVSWRIKFIEWCAAKGCFSIVWLHYWVVIRFLYSIIYK